MRNRIASIVTVLPFFAACASYSSDASLREPGTVDAQSLSSKLRCPRGATIVHGQTAGVETAMWCEKSGGVKHGPFIEWYENHHKKTAGEYIEGLRNGPWAFFLPNGQLDTSITYENGAATAQGAAPAAEKPRQ